MQIRVVRSVVSNGSRYYALPARSGTLEALFTLFVNNVGWTIPAGRNTTMRGIRDFAFFILLFCTWFVFPNSAGAAVWDLESDTWVATDALNRSLPGTVECGAPKANKTVGIFYFLWLEQNAPYLKDITKLKAGNLANPDWGARWSFHHWGESELGYYSSDDEYVFRRHCQMLVDAGVDVLCFDVTNALTYTQQYMKLCSAFRKIINEGGKTPQICFVANASTTETVQKLYNEFYSQNLYSDLWYYWLGKPLILSPPDGLGTTVQNFFTFRKTWAWNTGVDNWSFMQKYPQPVGYHTSPGTPEMVPVCIAEHPGSNIGRSCVSVNTPPGSSTWIPTEPPTDLYGHCATMDQGLYFAQQWSRVGTGTGQVSPPFVFITGWNEWIAQRAIEGLDGTLGNWAGHPLVAGDTWFVDAYSQEYSRDIEPMKGGHTDNYYYQMTDNIRRYKGARATRGAGHIKTIAMDGSFSDWDGVDPEYRDHVGDTEHRNSIGYANANTYTNNTGRNDFVRMKVARDATNVYFFVETSEDITPYTDPNWMVLFIDSDRNNATGWQGYDYIVNLSPVSPIVTTVKVNTGGWNWSQAGNVPYRVAGNKMELSIPRSLIGQNVPDVALDFHWADNLQTPGDITDFFINGDSAPARRFKYRYDGAAVGPPWEFTSNAEGWSAGHSILSFTQSAGTIQGTVYSSDPYINGPSTAGVNADSYRYVKISMRNSSASANTAEIRWKTLTNATYASSRAMTFPITCDNTYRTYTIDMRGNAEWKDWVYAFQLHPTGASSGTFSVDYIRILPDTTAPTGSISINSGATTTTSPTVTLSLSATDAGAGVSKMRLSNDGSNWNAWEDYAASKSWTFSFGDGVKTIYVQYRDLQMNRSATYSASISLLGVPPAGSVSINAGAVYTAIPTVTLALSATGPQLITEMRFMNSSAADWTAWEAYAASRSWSLETGDGPKTVYAQFRDSIGSISAAVSDSISLDMSGPTNRNITINSDASATKSVDVALSVSASDIGTSVLQMRFRNTGENWPAGWEPYTTGKAWSLIPGDGTKSVYVQFMDLAGNAATSTASIVLDSVPPSGSISINAGATYANSSDVILSLSGSDDRSGVGQMRFANSGGSWSDWEDFASTKSWTLTSGDGTRVVSAEFKDRAGNTATATPDSVVVDTVAPTIPGVPTDLGAFTLSNSVMFNWSGSSDAASGLDGYVCRVGTAPDGSDVFEGDTGTATTKTILGSVGNRYYCSARARQSRQPERLERVK